jgi:hypothetical protein
MFINFLINYKNFQKICRNNYEDYFENLIDVCEQSKNTTPL